MRERLSALAHDDDPQVCRAALHSLTMMGEGVDGDDQSVINQLRETVHEAELSDHNVEFVSADYPTSTLEAIERESLWLSSQAAAVRPRPLRPAASSLVEGIDPNGANQAVEPARLDRTTATAVSELHDDDRHVRRAALNALTRLQDRSAIEALRPLLFADAGALWSETLSTLLKLNDTELLPQLLAVLEQPEQEENHWIAVEALAEVWVHNTVLGPLG